MSDMGGGQIIAGQNGQPAPDDALAAALGQQPDEQEPPVPDQTMNEPSPDELEQAIMRATISAAHMVAGSSDASAVREGGQGILALVQALELLNAPDQQQPPPPPPAQVPVTPHAIGLVRHALSQDHGVDPATFDQLMLGAQGHVDDLAQGGSPTLPDGSAPADTSGGAGTIPGGSTS